MKTCVYMKFKFFVCIVFIADCIFSLNIEELKSLNYEVDVLQTAVKKEEPTFPVIYMMSAFGQEYQCTLPQVEEEEVEKENLNDKNTDIKELLKPMKSASCLLKGKDWWTYEFCFGHYIKQFHIEDGQILGPVIILGLYDSDFDWDNETSQDKFRHVKQRFHSQHYVNGTKCDLTGQPRTSEVRLYCEEDAVDYIYRVDEPGTCNYIITIHTSRLCSHPLLKPLPSKKAHSIPCHPLLNEEQYDSYLQKLSEEKILADQKLNEWLTNQQERLQEMKNEKEQPVDIDQSKTSKTEKNNKLDSKSKDTKDKSDDESEEVAIETFTDQDYDREPSKSKEAKLGTIKDETVASDDEEIVFSDDEETVASDEEETVASDEEETVASDEEETVTNDDDDDELEVRIRRLDHKASDTSGKLYEMDFFQRQKLEQAVKEKLEKAGLETVGRKIEVKIITSNYYDKEEGKDFQMLSEEESSQFQNLIMALLTGQQEAVQETDRHKKLEENYNFNWENNDVNKDEVDNEAEA